MKEKILHQVYDISSPFNEDMFIEGLKSQLSSEIFKNLIDPRGREQKDKITVEITMYSDADESLKHLLKKEKKATD